MILVLIEDENLSKGVTGEIIVFKVRVHVEYTKNQLLLP